MYINRLETWNTPITQISKKQPFPCLRQKRNHHVFNLQDGWHTLATWLATCIAKNTRIKAFYARLMDDLKMENPDNYLDYIDGDIYRVGYMLKENK